MAHLLEAMKLQIFKKSTATRMNSRSTRRTALELASPRSDPENATAGSGLRGRSIYKLGLLVPVCYTNRDKNLWSRFVYPTETKSLPGTGTDRFRPRDVLLAVGTGTKCIFSPGPRQDQDWRGSGLETEAPFSTSARREILSVHFGRFTWLSKILILEGSLK